MLDRFLNIFKASRTSTLVVNSGMARWSPRDYATFAREGYSQNVIVYHAIRKIAQAIASVPLYVQSRTGEELPRHPVLALLQRPNDMQSQQAFVEALVTARLTTGNAYLERVMVGTAPRELYSLRPERMAVIASTGSSTPSGYEYQGEVGRIRWDVDARGLCDIAHWRATSLTSDWYGLSPLEACAYAIDQHQQAMVYMQALLQNGAAPSGALKVPATTSLTEEQFTRLKEQIADKYEGAKNAGRALLLEGGMDWSPMGFAPRDVGVAAVRDAAARDIALALGVPPVLLNIPGDSTYSNFAEARLSFWEDTVIPLLFSLRDLLNVWLMPLYRDGAQLAVDIDALPVMADKRHRLWEMAERSTITTLNERREMLGYGPAVGGDEIYISSAMMPLSLAGMDISEPPPAQAGTEAYGDR